MTSFRPRVHWASPLPPDRTDIGHYTARILPELAQAFDLTVWTETADWPTALSGQCRVRTLDPDNILPRDLGPRQAAVSDILVIQIGNSADFHAGLLRLARRMPAVIVLHDVAVQELIHEAIRRGHFPVDQYRASMARWYGQDGLEAADAVLAQQGSAHALSRRFPGFEIICEQAVSVITHSRAAHDLVAARKLWPVYNLPLPFAVPDTPPALAPAQSGPLRLVQFGYLGENRQIDVVLDALASLRDQIAFRFDIIGDLLLPDYVKAAIADRDLEDRVHLHGFVSEAALDARVRQAHLVFNLRYPTMGEASGSQLRIWANGVASVVTDHGWYADIPDGTAFKVPVGGERAALEDILRNLDADRSAGVDMARAGHQHFRDHHSPSQYAQALAKVWDMYPQDAQHSYLQARRARFDRVPS